MTPETIAKWAGLGSAAWAVVSGIFNLLFWFKTPEEWVAFAESKPRTAALVRLVRAWGLDPNKGLIAIRDLAAQRRRPPSSTVRPPPNAPAVPPPAGLYLDSQTDRVVRPEEPPQ